MLVVALPLLCPAAIQELRAPADALRQGLLSTPDVGWQSRSVPAWLR
jgi:hypothetical protein